MSKKRIARADSLIDAIDIEIMHHLLKKSYLVLDLGDKLNISHQYLKAHLDKLEKMDLIERKNLKGRSILIQIKHKKQLTEVLGEIAIGAIMAGKIVVEDLPKPRPKSRPSTSPS